MSQVMDLNPGASDSSRILATKARRRRLEPRVIDETGSRAVLADRAFSPWEKVFCEPFEFVALTATVSAPNSPCRSGYHHQRPAPSNTLASSR